MRGSEARKPIERMGVRMYRDVKKKLLSVAICICMIIGLVQVVPKAKAAEKDKTISATLDGASAPSSIEVKYSLPEGVTYDGSVHMPTLISVYDKTNNQPVTNCILTTDREPKDAGTYKVYVTDTSGGYEFPNTELDSFTIEKANISGVSFECKDEVLLLKDS